MCWFRLLLFVLVLVVDVVHVFAVIVVVILLLLIYVVECSRTVLCCCVVNVLTVFLFHNTISGLVLVLVPSVVCVVCVCVPMLMFWFPSLFLMLVHICHSLFLSFT